MLTRESVFTGLPAIPPLVSSGLGFKGHLQHAANLPIVKCEGELNWSGKVRSMNMLLPVAEDVLMKEAELELAAFLAAVEQTHGARYVEKAETVWLNSLTDQPPSDCFSQSFFRRVTVAAASSLYRELKRTSIETNEKIENALAFLHRNTVRNNRPEMVQT